MGDSPVSEIFEHAEMGFWFFWNMELVIGLIIQIETNFYQTKYEMIFSNFYTKSQSSVYL